MRSCWEDAGKAAPSQGEACQKPIRWHWSPRVPHHSWRISSCLRTDEAQPKSSVRRTIFSPQSLTELPLSPRFVWSADYGFIYNQTISISQLCCRCQTRFPFHMKPDLQHPLLLHHHHSVRRSNPQRLSYHPLFYKCLFISWGWVSPHRTPLLKPHCWQPDVFISSIFKLYLNFLIFAQGETISIVFFYSLFVFCVFAQLTSFHFDYLVHPFPSFIDFHYLSVGGHKVFKWSSVFVFPGALQSVLLPRRRPCQLESESEFVELLFSSFGGTSTD